MTSVGVGRDDLVILPSFTFVASANAVSHCGAKPWFFDVTEESWTINVDQVRNVLETEVEIKQNASIHKPTGKKIGAIMPVYTLGHPADMDKIRLLANDFNLPIIADGAAALGSSYHKKNLGELADLTVFSFNGNKTITCGGGGMVVGNDQELLDIARHLSTTARCGKDYIHDQVGFNYRMTNIQAALGCAQIERLDEFVNKKRNIDFSYRAGLKDIDGLGFFPSASWAESACWFSGITLDSARFPDIIAVCERLVERGIQVRPFWKPMHMQRL